MLSGRESHSNISTDSTTSINSSESSSSIISITENESSIPVIDVQVNKFEDEIAFAIALDLNRFGKSNNDLGKGGLITRKRGDSVTLESRGRATSHISVKELEGS